MVQNLIVCKRCSTPHC